MLCLCLCYVMLWYVMLCYVLLCYVCMYACMYVCMHVWLCMYVCMYHISILIINPILSPVCSDPWFLFGSGSQRLRTHRDIARARWQKASSLMARTAEGVHFEKCLLEGVWPIVLNQNSCFKREIWWWTMINHWILGFPLSEPMWIWWWSCGSTAKWCDMV